MVSRSQWDLKLQITADGSDRIDSHNLCVSRKPLPKSSGAGACCRSWRKHTFQLQCPHCGSSFSAEINYPDEAVVGVSHIQFSCKIHQSSFILKIWPEERKQTYWISEKVVTPTLPPSWIKVLLHLQVSLFLYIILKWASWELKGPRRLLPPIRGEHLNRTWTSSPGHPPFDWVDHSGRGTWNWFLQRVSRHYSSLRQLHLGVPMGSGFKALGLSHLSLNLTKCIHKRFPISTRLFKI